MPLGMHSLVADARAVRDAWRLGGAAWVTAWRNLSHLLVRRQLVIATEAVVAGAVQPVLRTRLRLSGDSETEILRGWLQATPATEIAALAETHFRAVAVATASPAFVAAAKLGGRVIAALGTAGGLAVFVADAIRHGWAALGPALLANWGLLSSLAVAGLGFVLRHAFRFWLRRKLRPAAY
jgi:hypothetical protein